MSVEATLPDLRTDAGWDGRLQEVARVLPAVLDGLWASYGELERRSERVEHELAQANRERSELAERLHATDKLSALGTMAAGIAHEIRNPLNAVRGFAELLAQKVRGDARASAWAGMIVEGVLEVDAIIENLLSFGSPEKLRCETIDGQELVEEAAGLMRARSGTRNSAPDVRVRSEVPAFVGDRIKLRQAIRNLIENALEAQAELDTARVEVELVRSGDELECRVGDAGPGVVAELRSKILDPFFTTHADGTGLGLALVSVIARLHGGSVRCSPDPSPLGGALFVLRIPFQPAAPSAALSQPQRQ